MRLRMGSWRWLSRAIKLLEVPESQLLLVVRGWRARAADRHLDALADSHRDYLFRDLILLFGLNMLVFFARGQGINFTKKWDNEELQVLFRSSAKIARATETLN